MSLLDFTSPYLYFCTLVSKPVMGTYYVLGPRLGGKGEKGTQTIWGQRQGHSGKHGERATYTLLDLTKTETRPEQKGTNNMYQQRGKMRRHRHRYLVWAPCLLPRLANAVLLMK